MLAVYNQQACGVYANLTQKANPEGLLAIAALIDVLNPLQYLGGC